MTSTQRPRRQEQLPAEEEVVEVAPGVLRLQLPISLPGLGHVNTYAICDDRGVAVVDPGLPGPSSWKALTARLAAAGIGMRRIHTVLVTHSHPDHYGGAKRLARESGAELVAHTAFRRWASTPCTCDDPSHEHVDADGPANAGGDVPARPGPPWAGPTPWGGDRHRPPLRRRIGYRLLGTRFAPPEPSRRVRHGEVLDLGGREWVAHHTPGHTLDHLCLHDPATGVLLSGDHVLPTITPHISGVGAGPDPLEGFFRSLDDIAAVGPVTTVLPAHGQPFDDLAGRAGEIREHHEARLAELIAASHDLGWATVGELSQRLFKERSWGPMAESETFAHLEHLRLAGRAEVRRDDDALRYDLSAG
ncbi:MAG TPA: MBL fold metallo-hydrolase [Acidimicrobiales bacterium]|nr:MBL fold metallo-hydrolase [Acidimicrobiales bacterium]